MTPRTAFWATAAVAALGLEQARTHGVVLAVVRLHDPREAVAGGQHEVERGGEQPDEGLDAVARTALVGRQVRHRHSPRWWK